MKSSMSRYGHFLNLIGGHLVYISKTVYPIFTEEGIIYDSGQYHADLKKAISVGKVSVEMIESTSPPSFLESEHELFLHSFKNILGCSISLNDKIRLHFDSDIGEEYLAEEVSALRVIEDDFKLASMKVVEKIMLFSRR